MTGSATDKTVLVVEDDETTREALALELREAGYGCVTAGDGRAALDYLATHSAPDVIVLDMLLPVLDGWHFLQQLRQRGAAASIPVIIATATVISRAWALDHGCAGFVQKPVEAGALLDEIRRCL